MAAVVTIDYPGPGGTAVNIRFTPTADEEVIIARIGWVPTSYICMKTGANQGSYNPDVGTRKAEVQLSYGYLIQETGVYVASFVGWDFDTAISTGHVLDTPESAPELSTDRGSSVEVYDNQGVKFFGPAIQDGKFMSFTMFR